MNKQELLADLETKSLKIVKTVEDTEDTAKNEAGVRSYTTNVMEQDGDVVQARNIGWYTINEGTDEEVAVLRDLPKTKRDWVDKFESMLNRLSPKTFLRFKIESVDEEDRSGYATVIQKNEDKTVSEVRIFMYRDTVANENTYAVLK